MSLSAQFSCVGVEYRFNMFQVSTVPNSVSRKLELSHLEYVSGAGLSITAGVPGADNSKLNVS